MKLSKKIEKLRLQLIDFADGRSFSDPEVVAMSQRLDKLLNYYHTGQGV